MNHRIIARLDIKGPNLVKGIQLEGLRVLGNPASFAKHYYKYGIDELIYIDTVASLYERNSLSNLVSQTAKSIFIPLTVGGGIRSIADINNLLRAGADRVAINTAAIKNPDFINEASNIFGASTITVNIEAIKSDNGDYYAFIDNGRQYTGVEVIKWAREVESRGAGEIIITNVENEGTGKGLNVDLIREISNIVNIPVVAHGGIGKKKHILEGISNGRADAIAISSLLHYNTIDLINYSNTKIKEGNLSYLENKNSYLDFEKLTIPEIKYFLFKEGISIRTYADDENSDY